MNVQVTTQTIRDISGDALVIAAASKGAEKGVQLSSFASEIDSIFEGLLNERSADGEFRGGLGELLTLYPQGRLKVKRVLVVGLGKQEKVNAQSIRRASAIATRHLQQSGATQIILALESETVDAALAAQAQTEGALLGSYSFRSYQQQPAKALSSISVLASGNQETIEQAVKTGQALAEASNFSRNLVNEPASVLTPIELANRAREMAERTGLEYEIFEEDRIREEAMGGLLAVSQGSALPPRFIILRYRAANTDKQLALVGKGITFDTGGISLKPAENMDAMKGDMGGAAAVLGAMQAIATLKPNINVTALVPTCENMPSGTAFRPGDIVRISNGKTIEIVNTDAEGRLILADALSYAVKQGLSPIVDLATLTGAIVVSLGTVNVGLFSNDEELSSAIVAAGRQAGEKYWPMPMDEEYGEQIKSDIADIKQTGGRQGGSITAAKILEQFVGDSKWAHLDIAGTSYSDKKPYQEKGATGIGVRTLYQLAQNLAK